MIWKNITYQTIDVYESGYQSTPNTGLMLCHRDGLYSPIPETQTKLCVFMTGL